MIKFDLSDEIRLIWIAEPPGNSSDLFLFLAQELGIKPSSSERTFVVRDIRDALLKINSEGSKCLVIIDEAHLMSDDTINGIRLLNNLEEGSTKLIQILLLGQEELMGTINRPEMEPFKQRIATLEVLGKMNADRIRKYILHRIKVAGGQPSIFADTGWEALVLAFSSGSTPRIINSLCDRTLNVAFEREKKIIDVDDVYEAAQGMGLQKEIFFYKVALKQKERKEQVPSTRENDSITEPETLGKGPVDAFSKESDGTDIENEDRESETSQSTQKEAGIDFIRSEKDQKGLKTPLLFLFLSISVLILSIFFYCQRSGSPDSMTCLQGFFG
jgi:general secretion pathway protein A